MGELLIGSRRGRTRSTARALGIIGLLLIIAGVVAYLIFRRVTAYEVPGGSMPDNRIAATPEGRLTYGNASLEQRGRLRVLRLRGGPHEVGAARGRLLGRDIATVGPAFDAAITHSIPPGGWFSRRLLGSRLRWNYRLLDDGIPGHQLVEIAGLMRGVDTRGPELEFRRLVRREAAFDVGAAVPEASERVSRTIARSLTFVTPVRTTGGDRLLIGRSFETPGIRDGGDAAAATVTVAFVHPKDAIPFASVAWPGAVGVVSGVNREGVAVMVHPARTSDVRIARVAQPMALLARDVLESATSLNDAISILEQSEPLGAASYVIVDGNARTWAVVERSPERVAVLRTPPSPVITDILTGEPFHEDPINDHARRTLPATARGKRAAELLRAGAPESVADAVAVLRDRRGRGGTQLPPGHRAAVDDLDAVHTALFDASAMVLWVSEGPGAAARFRAFDLRYELRDEGARPAPPPDIPAEADFDPTLVESVRAARAELRAARRDWSDDERGAAREHVERALGLAPTLPPAHKLAGDIARAAGDDEAARRHYQRYLELSPADTATEQEVKALVER